MSRKAQIRSASLLALVLLIVGFLMGSAIGSKIIAYTHTATMVTTSYSTFYATNTVTTREVKTEHTTVSAIIPVTTTITSEATTTIFNTTTLTINHTHTVTISNVTVTTTSTKFLNTTIQAQILVCFSRPEYCKGEITSAIRSAKQYVYVMAYIFTSNDIAQALLDVHNKGVNVKVIIEGDMMNVTGSQYTMLKDAGIDVRLEKTSYLMHHKVIIIDGQIVITGSYNFSDAAEDKNYENLLIIKDSKIAQQYEQEFNRVIQNSSP